LRNRWQRRTIIAEWRQELYNLVTFNFNGVGGLSVLKARNHMQRIARWPLMLSAIISICAQGLPALAEQVYSETFDSLADWGGAAPDKSVKDHILTLTAPSQGTAEVMNRKLVFNDMDATVTARVSQCTKPGTAVSLGFWGTDKAHIYFFNLHDNGTGDVSRSLGATRAVSVGGPFSTGIKVGEWKKLRVVTKGDSVTLYVDGKQLG
jgi:hypothetical protein